MIIDYDRRPNATEDARLQSLIDSIMLALNTKADKKEMDRVLASVKEGSADHWYYKINANGTFEAWLNLDCTVSLQTAVSNVSGWYRDTNAYTLTIPPAIRNARIKHADIHPVSGIAGMFATVTSIDKNTIKYYVVAPASSGTAISQRDTVMTAYVFGTWS